MASGDDTAIHALSSTETLQRGIRALERQNPAFSALTSTWGDPQPWFRAPGFATLGFIVFEQLVSMDSAKASWVRLEERIGTVTPEAVVALGVEGVKDVGTTRAKAVCVVEIANRITAGDLDLDAVADLPDAAAAKALTSIRGIGPWTAEVYLLSALRRADLFPAGDRALVVAAHEFGLTKRELTSRELATHARSWSPWRSVSAWLLWNAYLKKRNRKPPT